MTMCRVKSRTRYSTHVAPIVNQIEHAVPTIEEGHSLVYYTGRGVGRNYSDVDEILLINVVNWTRHSCAMSTPSLIPYIH